MNKDFSQSFVPIFGNYPRVLFLGTMPGKESISQQQYYAHPQNSFWKILYKIFNEQFSLDYVNRIDFAKRNQIALWDVCQTCIRKGSLDYDIKQEIPNKIHDFLKVNKSIQRVILNGKKAEKLYKKHFDFLKRIKYFTVLSSSPTNAAYTFDQKFENWKLAIGME